eukprot:g3578.t3
MESSIEHQDDERTPWEGREAALVAQDDPRERERQQHPRAEITQIKALLKRNLLERQRTKTTTFCEFFSPVLLLCVLVYGYSLSDILVFPEKMYSSIRVELPGGFGGLLPLARLHSQDLANATLSSLNSSALDDTEVGADTEFGADTGGLSFQNVKNVFEEMTGLLDGPCPVPNLDQFVGLGTSVAGDLDDVAYGQVVNSMESGWVFGNLITQGTLHFAPAREPAVGELLTWLSNTTKGFDMITHRVHESEDDAVAYALDHLEERTWAVIALDEASSGRVDYTIRMNFTVVPNTNTVVDMISIGLDPSFRSYYLSGFLTLQTTLDRFMFNRALPAAASSEEQEGRSEEQSGGFTCVPPDVIGVPFPTAAYDQNLFYKAVGYLLGLAMTMSTMYPLSRLVKGVVEEKESRVRETMRIMGLRVWCHEVSWLITGAAVFTFIAITVAALLSWTFLPLADGSLLLVYMMSFSCSEVGMALLVASVFSQAKLASIAAPCVLFAGVLPRYIFYGSNRHEAPRSKTFASLLSPAAFTFGADFIADYEYAGIGAGWGNYDEGDYSLRTSIGMMFLDAVLYGLMAWYLDKVVTPEFGTARDPLKALTSLPGRLFRWARRRGRFPPQSRGWIPLAQAEQKEDGDEEAASDTAGDGLAEGAPQPRSVGGVGGTGADFEPLEEEEGQDAGGAAVRRGVVIKELRKEFGSKVAVAGLDLRLRVGDITCLLGHNGAGKSTTISMLTGQLGATSGDAVVWGHSVRNDLHKVRQSIGICPQHDALMPLLTAREHMEMYMDMKGMRPDLKGPLVTKKLREVGLLEKEHTPAMSLSGGQKRKLSVALALTGSPTLCILDEPTSSMDPYSRRFTWDLLRRGRAGRCTLLSTHFMEEADHLGDRIAMLRKGQLRCAGSPLFLKSRFGLGYKLTLVKAGQSFEPSEVIALVLSHVAHAQTLSSAGGEISFRLPREESRNFPDLFRALEAGREAMGVGGYGVSITSLEEVFLSLEKQGELADARCSAGAIGCDEGDEAGEAPMNGCRSSSSSSSFGERSDGSKTERNLRNRRGASGRDAHMARNGNSNGRWGDGTPAGQAREIEMHSMAGTAPVPASSALRTQHEEPQQPTFKRSRSDIINDATTNTTTNNNNDKNNKNRNKSESNRIDGSSCRESYASFAHDDQEDLASLLAEVQQDDQAYRPSPAEAAALAGAGEPRGATAPRMQRAERTIPSSDVDTVGDGKGVTGAGLWDQLCWLLWKRRVVALRDWRGGLYQILLPAVLVALVLILLTIDVKLAGPSLPMSGGMFGSRTQVLYAEGVEGEGGARHRAYAKVAEGTESWTHVGRATGLTAPTSSGLSRFMLDTYNTGGLPGGAAAAAAATAADSGVDVTFEQASSDGTIATAADLMDGEGRPPRYGAFVFGDRIAVNLTVDWDTLREKPELVESALEIVGDDVIPADGGEIDLERLLAATGLDKDKLAKLILQGSSDLNQLDQGDEDVAEAFLPGGNGTRNDALAEALRWAQGKNWTHEWLDLVAQDPTVRFTHAEYLPQSKELKLDGVVLSSTSLVDNQPQYLELGEVTLSVDDVLKAVPPGVGRYDQGVLAPNRTSTTVMFNSTAPHALPAWLGELTAKTFQACAAQRGLDEGQASYTTRSHPLPLTATESLEVQTMLSVLVSLLVTVPLCYAPAAFVTFLVRERACKSKRVQLVSGASPFAYWMSTYLWDVLLFSVLSCLVMLTFAAYGRDASKVFMMHWDALLGTWGLLLSYGVSALPLSYLYSFGFNGPSAAQISIAGVNFVSGFGFVVAYAVLSSLEKTVKFAARAQHVFRLFPPYLLGDGLIRVSSEFFMREVLGMEREWGVLAWDVAGRGICYMLLEAAAYLSMVSSEFFMREVLGMEREWGVLAWDVAGRGICYMLLEAAAYLSMVLVVEYSLAAGVRAKVDRLRLRLGGWSDADLAAMLRTSTGASEDADVKNERTRVERAMAAAIRGGGWGNGARGEEEEADTVLIGGLTKVYPAPMSSAHKSPKCAVRGLNLGVKKGECFGLLGINGAGKSTTLQILTRDLQATSGHITVKGRSISSSAVCRLLGYCPQTDPLLPLMTVLETLLFFGGLKGVSLEQPRGGGAGRDSSLEKTAAAAMSAVSLGPTENQLAGTLSGGNKRKLSLAVALIGGPPVLLLDEPSSGMDPGARRSMWKVISSLAESRSVILTTHCMEECEAVCDRLGIMVGGRLRCIGTSQHLKEVFGGGYSIEVRCPTGSMPQVKEMIQGLSPLARLDEMHPTLAKFSVPAGRELSQRRPGSSESGAGGARGGGNGGGGGAVPTGGLSLSRAFETIEARKAELQIWDYSISQTELETIFMSFAKNQEEEATSVPGVRYADDEGGTASRTNDGGGHGGNSGNGSTGGRGRNGRTPPRSPPSMDVEMGSLRGKHSRIGGSSSDAGHCSPIQPPSGEGADAGQASHPHVLINVGVAQPRQISTVTAHLGRWEGYRLVCLNMGKAPAAMTGYSYRDEGVETKGRRGRAWEGHLARLYVVNYAAVAVFAASMYRIMRLWDGPLNRMQFFPLAIPFIGVFASLTYLFGFFGISIIAGVMDPPFLSSPAPSPKHGSSYPSAAKTRPEQFSPADESSSSYSLDSPEVVIVGAGTAGASAAVTLARQGRKVLLVERCMSEQDRIVGELLQPGGLRALERLGLDACAKEGTDSVIVDGYAIIKPGDAGGGPASDGAEEKRGSVMLYYPESDPEKKSELFGNGVKPAAAGGTGEGAREVPRGRSFHNCRFVQRLRETALAEPNVRVVEATVSNLLEGENGEVVGVRYRESAKEGADGQDVERATHEVRAPLTVVADGIWSGLRKCANTNRPQKMSTFVGVLVTHPPDAAPVPHKHCGHVVLAHPSPILIYQISSTETRVLVDVAGAMPSATEGGLAAHLREKSAPQLPALFRPAFLEAVARGDVKSMPNRTMPASNVHRQGALLLGDALNMRHPLTGGGMTVAIKDVELLSNLLQGVSFEDAAAVAAVAARFHEERRAHASTINVLANALYQVFSTPDDPASKDTRVNLQTACFDYLSLGGCYSAGPVGLLSGLSPVPWVLATHFFMVAFHGCRTHLLPLPTPGGFLRVYRLLHVATKIIMPLLDEEGSTFLAWWPVKKRAERQREDREGECAGHRRNSPPIMDGGRGPGGRGGGRNFRPGFRRGGGGGGGGSRGRRDGRGGRGGGRGGWRGGGRGNRGGGGGWGKGGRGGGGRGRGGSPDWYDRRPAEPTAETLAMMGTRATESTVGITHFMTESDSGFSGVLKQRFSDFIVHEVAPGGDICKGTDFPGLLRPIEHVQQPGPPEPHPSEAAEAAPSEEGQDKEGEEGSSKDESSRGGGPKSDEDEADEDVKRKRLEEEEKIKKDEEEQETRRLIKAGAEALFGVLGEEVAAKVEAFVLEGVSISGADKRTLNLPTSDKITRTKVYQLLKQHLSKYVLAVTVDEPASTPAPSPAAEAESTGDEVKTETAAADIGNETAEDTAATTTVGTVDKTKEGSNRETDGDSAADESHRKKKQKVDAENGGHAPAVEQTEENTAELTAEKAAVAAAAVKKPVPNGPKCVQLKMKPDWRRTGGGKRRRGNLDKDAVGGRGGGRWAWPEDRPEYCRFVLYKENSDTMGAVSRMSKHFRFSGRIVGYAGTKDKRGVTSQWCTVRKKSIEELRTFNRPLGAHQGPMVLLGNFSYVEEPLRLGDLEGNRFGIVLRNLTLPSGEVEASTNGNGDAAHARPAGEFPSAGEEEGLDAAAAKAEAAVVEAGAKLKETVDRRCAWVKERGFVNYFGLQRFGSGGAPTSDVGIAMLKGDWEGAVKLIMKPRLGENEATHNSKVHYLKNPTDIQGTLNKLPFFMDAEKSMMQALLRGGPNAHVDALLAVPKNLQLMYLHAVQSLLWNLAASERIKLYGREGVVEGDLVFPPDVLAVEDDPILIDAPATVDDAAALGDGDQEGDGDPEAKRAKRGPTPLPRVHAVTKEDVKAGTFQLTDVILPMPGSGVTYPSNGVAECYTRALEERGLTEACFSSSTQKSFNLGGAYRRLILVPKDLEWEVKRYDDHTLHLINTDIDDLLDIDDARIAKEEAEKKKEAAAAADAEEGDGGEPPAPDAMDVADTTPQVEIPKPLASTRPQGRYHGLCLHFTLPSAAYATMCLREITLQDTSTSFHTSLNTLAPGQHPVNKGARSAAETSAEVGAGHGDIGENKVKSPPPKGAVIKVGSSLR